jgi:sulfide:quinone oxidoreductase
MPPTDAYHGVLIVGGGTAGITVAARLHRAGVDDVGLIEPSATHYYQPLWTLVGGGRASITETARPEAKVMPKGTDWIQDAAEDIDPENKRVTLRSGRRVSYDKLVVAPGIQLDWGKVPGLPEALDTPHVSSNYTYGLAPKTWARIKGMRKGTAVFTMPTGPIKCGGAPQKIAYMAADHWRREGVLDDIRVVLVLPSPAMFGVKVFSDELEKIVARYGMEVHLNSELTEVDGEGRLAVVTDHASGTKEAIGYDFLHVVPPQSAPDWVKATPLADPGSPAGYVEIDKHTLRHTRYPDVFALGDAGSSPNSKTGAAVRKQAPVVVKNLLAVMDGDEPTAEYDGYSSCPIVTAQNRMLLCEFDYSMQPHPTIPLIDTTHERYDMWLLKRYGLPFMYWNLMLRGLA